MPTPTASQLVLVTLLVGLAFVAGYEWTRRTSGVKSATQQADIARDIRDQTSPQVSEELRRDLADEVTRDLEERGRDGVTEDLSDEERERIRGELRREERLRVREELREAERPGVIARLEEIERARVRAHEKERWIHRGRADAETEAFEAGVEYGRQQVLGERREARRRWARDFVDSDADGGSCYVEEIDVTRAPLRSRASPTDTLFRRY